MQRRYLLSKSILKNPLSIVTILAVIFGLSCMAKYRTIHKAKAGLSSDPGENSLPSTKKDRPMGPSAGIEAVLGGQVVTQVPSGQDFIIRPTQNTRDPDNKVVANCPNPGIVKAHYLMDQEIKDVVRSSECSDLGFTYQFPTPGTYVVTMQVISDENEKADASMTLVVNDSAGSDASKGGLIVTADPMITGLGSGIQFKAACADGKGITVVWRFADSETATAITTTHIYKAIGPYTVMADCQKNDTTISASVTVVVVDPSAINDSDTDVSTGNGTSDGTTTGDEGQSDGSVDGATTTAGSTTAGNSTSGSETAGNTTSHATGGTGTSGGTGSSATSGTTSSGSSTGTAGTSGGSGGTTDGDDDSGSGNDDGPGQNPKQNPGQNPGQSPK